MDRPNHTYYRTIHGRWHCKFQFAITDWRLFWASSVKLTDRLHVLSTVLTRKIIGPLALATQVDFHASGEYLGEVHHEARIHKWGLTFMNSTKVFTLHEYGRGSSTTVGKRLR